MAGWEAVPVYINPFVLCFFSLPSRLLALLLFSLLAFRSRPLPVLSPATRYFLFVFFPMASGQAQAHVPLKVSIKLVIPGILVDEEEKTFPIEDLERMGCGGILETLGVCKTSRWCANSKKAYLISSKAQSRGVQISRRRSSGGACMASRPTVLASAPVNTNT